MATRTSSPPASRSRSTSTKGASTSRSRPSGSQSKRKPPAKKGASKNRRPAPRAVRNGPGPVSRTFAGLGHGITAVWLGVAGGIGSGARRVGQGARDLEPEHRRDGAGLFLIGLAVVVAAAIWWDLPGAVGNGVRTVVGGSIGMLGWALPLMLLLIAVRTLRHPDHNGPAGRQVIGWTAVCLGVLGLIHIANGLPRPSNPADGPLSAAGGAIGYFISSFLSEIGRAHV